MSGIGSDQAPDLGQNFWRTDQMRDAFATRDMGTVVRTYRYHPTHGHKALPQGTLARWLDVTQSQLSRIESGRNKVDTLDKLIHYARSLKMPADFLWFELPADQVKIPRRSREVLALPDGPLVPAASSHTDSALADSLLGTLERYSNTDNLAGPRSLITIAPQQLGFVDDLLANAARGKDRRQLLYVEARYAEFAGWVYQDSGALNSAMQMSSNALDSAQEAGDETLTSYILMRRSNIATDASRPELALKLVNAALERAASLPPRYRAVALRQKAHALAQLGQASECAAALEQAFHLAEQGDDSENSLAPYCTPEYIEMEAAHCWVELGDADKAINTLRHSLAVWKPEFRRDLGLCLARLAVAHATGDQVDHALIVAEQSLDIARETKSSRTEDQLSRLPAMLIARGATDEARRFERSVRSLQW